MGANYLQDMANLDQRGKVGMIHVGDHPTLLYTKYTSCGIIVIEKKIFKKISI